MANSNLLPKRKLGNTDMEVSVISFGCGPLGGTFQDFDEQEAIKAVHIALENGINMFDTSPYYGDTRSETLLGRALTGIPRNQFYIASKCGRLGLSEFNFTRDHIRKSLYSSLKRLNLTYLDILYCHDIEFVDLDQIINETIPAMLELKKEGLIRYIGFTGFPLAIFPAILDRVPEGSVDVVLSYCHCTLIDNSLLQILPYLKSKGVGVVNASVMAMGLLTQHGPSDWHPASYDIKSTCQDAVEFVKEQGKNISDIALKFSLSSSEDICTHLVGILTADEVSKNINSALAAFKSSSPEEEKLLKHLAKLFKSIQGKTWSSGLIENN